MPSLCPALIPAPSHLRVAWRCDYQPRTGGHNLKANADRLDELADKLDEDKIVYVSAYEVTRQYGGAEEGGWWYNWLDLVETTASLRRDADEVVETLKARHQHRAVGDIYSVLGGVAIQVDIEDESGESQSKERPHYS